MKMELIAALIHRPKVIYLDEPTIGLDLISQKRIREFLKYYNQQMKTTILLTSHYMNDIEELCKRTIIINQGVLVYDNDLTQMNEKMGYSKILKLKCNEAIEEERLLKYGKIRKNDGYQVELQVDKQRIKEYAKLILDEFDIVDINIDDIPIEEGIESIYSKKVGEAVENIS